MASNHPHADRLARLEAESRSLVEQIVDMRWVEDDAVPSHMLIYRHPCKTQPVTGRPRIAAIRGGNAPYSAMCAAKIASVANTSNKRRHPRVSTIFPRGRSARSSPPPNRRTSRTSSHSSVTPSS